MPLSYEQHRRELGLGPPPSTMPETLRIALVATLVFAGAWAAGSAGGAVYRHGLRLLFQARAFSLLETADSRTLAGQMHSLSALAARLPDDPMAQYRMAALYLHAADAARHRLPLWNAALSHIRQCRAALPENEPNPAFDFQIARIESALLQELGRDREALRALHDMERAAELLGMDSGPDAALMHNNLAYQLVSASDPSVRDPKRALELAKKAVAEPPAAEMAPSAQPAFLDTLAEAYFRAGQHHQALGVQRWALALATDSDLALYLEHYDRYAEAAETK